MIEFACAQCNTRYTVPDDRTGQRTRCARCRTPLVVPPLPSPSAKVAPESAGRARRPATLVVPAIAVLMLSAFVVYLVTPPPSRETVERRLRESLPPGFEQLTIEEFDRDTGRVQFRVRYFDNSHLPTEYEVLRYRHDIYRVKVTGRRRQPDRPVERWLMVEASFDRRGRIIEKKGMTLAPPGEGPLFEERARAIAIATHGVF